VVAAALLVAPVRAMMSPADEAEIGRRFALEARARLPLIEDIEVNLYVERIGRAIVAALGAQPFTYEFLVVRDGRINAFAVPGGQVYVYAGLLTAARSEDEIAGVLGHEIAHVHAHHIARQQEATKVVNYAAMLGMLLAVVQPALGAGVLAAQAAAQLQYSREFEQEADFLGARYMQEAGFESIGMLDFFKRLSDQNRQAASAEIPPYLLTHPLSDDRLTNLEAVLRERQWDARPRRPMSLELERVQLLTAIRAEQREEVVRHYAARAEAAPEDGRARYLHGLALLEVGRLDAAAAALEAARGLGFAAIERELGRVRLSQRRIEEARKQLEAAVHRAPEDPVAQHALGKVLESGGDRAAALAAYREAVRLAPQMEVAQHDLGVLAGRTGDVAAGFYHLGVAFRLRGEYQPAVSQFEKAMARAPADSDVGRRARAELKGLGISLREEAPVAE
jgi:predicted Zn-dependent protease